MHDSVVMWAYKTLQPKWIKDARVLEVGSLDVNGSLRSFIEPMARSYFGIDMRDGPGVDQVLAAEDLDVDEEYDLVVCTEMLEHCLHWQMALFKMKQAVKVGGLLLLTTRSPGMIRHGHPDDYWRFTAGNIAEALWDFEPIDLSLDPEYPGVFCLARRRANAVGLTFIAVEEAPRA